MGNGSPTAYLLWAILSCTYLVFLLLHLWNYDRFQCLRWDAGRQPGAFKRVMTYSYLATVPLLVVFSVAMSVIKFKEGFIQAPNGKIIPRPFSLWDPANRAWLLPLYFVLSIAWSLEHVTHLEELTFWVFLLNQGPGKREWFASWEFRVWTIGSVATLTGMPMTALAARHDLDTCLAYLFLVGASTGTATTLCFHYVLARFPWFIRHVKSEGAEPDVVVRLATFFQLNRIRVLFRYLFTLPLMIVAIDGLAPPYPIVGDPFALDFLLMMGGIGCFVSSAITLLVFFPRSITQEAGYHPRAPTTTHTTNNTNNTKENTNKLSPYRTNTQSSKTTRGEPVEREREERERYFHTSSSATRTHMQQELELHEYGYACAYGDDGARNSGSRSRCQSQSQAWSHSQCASTSRSGCVSGSGCECESDSYGEGEEDDDDDEDEEEDEEEGSTAGPSSHRGPSPASTSASTSELSHSQHGHARQTRRQKQKQKQKHTWESARGEPSRSQPSVHAPPPPPSPSPSPPSPSSPPPPLPGQPHHDHLPQAHEPHHEPHSHGPHSHQRSGSSSGVGKQRRRGGATLDGLLHDALGLHGGSGSGNARGKERDGDRGRGWQQHHHGKVDQGGHWEEGGRDRDREGEGEREGDRERGGEGDRTKARRRTRREHAEARQRMLEESALHPYVINFTSPLDLLDAGGGGGGMPTRRSRPSV